MDTAPPEIAQGHLDEILGFIAATGISEATFGNRAVNDWTFVDRLREGRATLKIVQRALDYLRAQIAVEAAKAAAE